MIQQSNYQADFFNRAAEMAAAPRLFPDGDKWCALYGDNLQEGLAGFGDTPEGAMADFDHNFRTQRLEQNGQSAGTTPEKPA
jgi:hypothetical protein